MRRTNPPTTATSTKIARNIQGPKQLEAGAVQFNEVCPLVDQYDQPNSRENRSDDAEEHEATAQHDFGKRHAGQKISPATIRISGGR